MIKRVGAREARTRSDDLLDNAHYGVQALIIERSGKPIAAVIPVEMYQQVIAERETRFQVLDRIRSRPPYVSAQEVTRDVAQAIEDVRSKGKT